MFFKKILFTKGKSYEYLLVQQTSKPPTKPLRILILVLGGKGKDTFLF